MYYELPRLLFTFCPGTSLTHNGELFPLPPFLARPHFLVGGRSGSKELDRASLARRACTALPSRSKPVVMVPQREEHVGRPSARRQSCAAPRVSPTRCCSAPLSSGVSSGTAASTAQSWAPFSFETPPMTHPRSLRAHPRPLFLGALHHLTNVRRLVTAPLEACSCSPTMHGCSCGA